MRDPLVQFEVMRAEMLLTVAGVGSFLVGAAAVAVAIKGVRDQLWLQTFSEYTRRYAEIVKVLPSESRDPNGNFDVESLRAAERGVVENAARAYINLCSEEFYLHGRGRIDKETWNIWRLSMEDVFRLPWLRQTWLSVQQEYRYYPEFCAFLSQCIERYPDSDQSAEALGARSARARR